MLIFTFYFNYGFLQQWLLAILEWFQDEFLESSQKRFAEMLEIPQKKNQLKGIQKIWFAIDLIDMHNLCMYMVTMFFKTSRGLHSNFVDKFWRKFFCTLKKDIFNYHTAFKNL